MITDQVLAPAFTVASTPGAYALLLGAGASKSSGAPSAWEVQTEFTLRVAAVLGEDVQAEDAVQWWTDRFGVAPNYSDVSQKVAGSQHERQALRRALFEPDQSNDLAQVHIPSAGHKAMTQLVSTVIFR